MNRTYEISLNKVDPVPNSLRLVSEVNLPTAVAEVNLGSLYLQKYVDSYPTAPKVDPTSFSYLDRISAAPDFRFHDFVARANSDKKGHISNEFGQAFCRQILSDHFGIVYFVHLKDVLNKETHPAFGGLTIHRRAKGDTPDYLCAKRFDRPIFAEAKGTFSDVSFSSAKFQKWREQFQRIEVRDGEGNPKTVKGYIVATRLAGDSSRKGTKVFVEDPESFGEEPLKEFAGLVRGTASIHYSYFFRKLGLTQLASALNLGYSLTSQLSFQVPLWTCMTEPFKGTEYVGGILPSDDGEMPELTEKGWKISPYLNRGHAVFVGLERRTAEAVAGAARGTWGLLGDLPFKAPKGAVSSEFCWLPDGTVMAPLTDFLPSGVLTL